MQDAMRNARFAPETESRRNDVQCGKHQSADCFRFIRRQLFWTRLYHPQWTGILVGSLLNYVLLVGSTLFAIATAWQGEYLLTAMMAAVIFGVTCAESVDGGNSAPSHCFTNKVGTGARNPSFRLGGSCTFICSVVLNIGYIYFGSNRRCNGPQRSLAALRISPNRLAACNWSSTTLLRVRRKH